MAEGLSGQFRDFGANRSFADLTDFYGHLREKGRHPVTGHINCSSCYKHLSPFKGCANVNPENGQATVVCKECRAAIVAEEAAAE